MAAYLKNENVGFCPPEGFTVLGVSLADTSDNQGVIGQLGSGNKHGIAVCLHNNLAPVVFCGTRRLDFFNNLVNRAQHFLHLLGWSCGDSCFQEPGKPPVWTVFAHREADKILTRAETQAAAWDEALQQAGIVQRDN